jgi:hypothetical protein
MTVDTGKVHLKGIGTEWQLEFSIGVQHFDIGPRYETLAEAEWFMNQFFVALNKMIDSNKLSMGHATDTTG